jgi:two-component system CheB/CheR fusion protein
MNPHPGAGDASFPWMGGLKWLEELTVVDDRLPFTMNSGKSEVSMAVDAMKAGASDPVEISARRRQGLRGAESPISQL